MSLVPTEHQNTVPDTAYPTDPRHVVDRAARMAQVLLEVVQRAKDLEVHIGGRRYLRAEAWMTVAAFHSATVTVDSVDALPDGKGYVARASVHARDGRVISSAESSCSRDEPAWQNRPDYALRSMAQTRAAAKALRLAFAYIPVLAGFAPTPAEEVEEQQSLRPQPQPSARNRAKENPLSQFRAAMAQEGWPESRARELWAVLWPEAQRWRDLSASQQALVAEAAHALIRLVRDHGPEGARRMAEELLPPGELVTAQQIAELASGANVLSEGHSE